MDTPLVQISRPQAGICPPQHLAVRPPAENFLDRNMLRSSGSVTSSSARCRIERSSQWPSLAASDPGRSAPRRRLRPSEPRNSSEIAVLRHLVVHARAAGPRLEPQQPQDRPRNETKVVWYEPNGPWQHAETVDFATLEWVDWFKKRPVLAPIGYVPAVERKHQYHCCREDPVLGVRLTAKSLREFNYNSAHGFR